MKILLTCLMVTGLSLPAFAQSTPDQSADTPSSEMMNSETQDVTPQAEESFETDSIERTGTDSNRSGDSIQEEEELTPSDTIQEEEVTPSDSIQEEEEMTPSDTMESDSMNTPSSTESESNTP